VRFEVMRRLGWVEEAPQQDAPIVELVRLAWKEGSSFSRETPRLSPRHPGYEAYRKLALRDQVVFIRRLVPAAVENFRRLMPSEPA